MLDFLLYPKSIAVIGASRKEGKVGHEIMVNLIEGGFKGKIIPVNPTADEVLGLKCYHDLDEHKGDIDLSVIAVPAEYVLDSVKDSIDARAKAVAIITAGFAELGPEGNKVQTTIAGMCADANVRLLGPNCLGVINTHHRMNASFSKKMPKSGGFSQVGGHTSRNLRRTLRLCDRTFATASAYGKSGCDNH